MTTTERTIERPRVERTVEPKPTTRRGALTSVVTVIVALLLGLLGGYVLRGGDDAGPEDLVIAGGDEATARQEQMAEFMDDYVDAWQRGDADALVAMYTDRGVLTIFGSEFPVEGGRLADYVRRSPEPNLELLEPVLVSGTTMLNVHRLSPGSERVLLDVIDFTATGELLIVSHDILG